MTASADALGRLQGLRAGSDPRGRVEAAVQRRVRLLARLREHPFRGHDTADLCRSLRCYPPGEAGHRMLRRDAAFLAARGLVAVSPGPDSDGLRVVELIKPERWELTAAEHDALARARRQHARGRALPSPLPHDHGAPGEGPDALDLLMRLLRAVEEHGHLTVRRLAELLATTPDRVVRTVRTAHDLHDHGALTAVVVGYPHALGTDTADDADGQRLGDADDDIYSVEILRPRTAGRSPTRGRGLDHLGRFAYDIHECDDRLALIATALAAGPNPPLESARRKLAAWREHLLDRPRS